MLEELDKVPPNEEAALGKVEGIAGDLEASLSEGFDPAQAFVMLDEVAGLARAFAEDAIAAASARVRGRLVMAWSSPIWVRARP